MGGTRAIPSLDRGNSSVRSPAYRKYRGSARSTGKRTRRQASASRRGAASSLGFYEIQLYTNAAFASNLSFYSRRGYQEYRRGTPGRVTVSMRRRIDASA